MKVISRGHAFENRLTLVQKGRVYFYLWHEKSRKPTVIKITSKGLTAFRKEDWDYFCQKEAGAYGGAV